MGSFNIQWKRSARKELKKLGKKVIPRIVHAVDLLADEPHPSGSRKLVGSEHIYRIRVGDYRVVYSMLDDVLCVEIIRVGHRKDVYRQFR